MLFEGLDYILNTAGSRRAWLEYVAYCRFFRLSGLSIIILFRERDMSFDFDI